MTVRIAALPLVATLFGCGGAPQLLPFPNKEGSVIAFPGRWGESFRARLPANSEMKRFQILAENMPSQVDSLALATNEGSLQWRKIPGHQRDLWESELFFSGRRVLGMHLKWTGHADAPSWMSGSVPTFPVDSGRVWVNPDEAISLQKSLELVETRTQQSTQCLELREEIWIPTKQGLNQGYLIARKPSCTLPGGAHLSFTAVVDAHAGALIRIQPDSFDLVGTASVYKENSVTTPQLSKEELPELAEPGNALNGRYLRVKNCFRDLADLNICRATAKGKKGVFSSTPADESFDEEYAYYALSSAMSWHRSMMSGAAKTSYVDFGLNSPIDVLVRAARKSQTGEASLDNASYLPHGITSNGYPMVVVGTGWEPGDPPDGDRLKNLGKDADVYRHEFAHHIIIRSIRDITGQGLALHEGFADFFADAQSGNNAMCESIVQGAGGALRRADDERPIDAALVQEEGHVQGEHWSSVLWSLRTALGQGAGGFVLDKILWNSIDYLPDTSGYYQAIAALLKATDALASEMGLDAKATRVKLLQHFYSRGYFASDAGVSEGVIPPPATFLSFTDPSVEATLVSTPRTYPAYAGPRPDQIATAAGEWQLRQPCSVANTHGTSRSQFVLLSLPLAALALLSLSQQKTRKRKENP